MRNFKVIPILSLFLVTNILKGQIIYEVREIQIYIGNSSFSIDTISKIVKINKSKLFDFLIDDRNLDQENYICLVDSVLILNKEHPNNTRHFEISTDQDVLAKTNEDRDYTMGVSFQFKRQYEFSNVSKIFRFSDVFFNLFKFTKNPNNVNVYKNGLVFSAFTPENLAIFNPDSNDRPYSSLFLFNFRRENYHELDCKLGIQVAFENVFGLTGRFSSQIAQFTQAAIHAGQAVGKNDSLHQRTAKIPRGWHNSIAYGSNFPIIFNSSLSMGIGRIFNFDCPFKLGLNSNLRIDAGLIYNSISLSGGVRLILFDNQLNYYNSDYIYKRSNKSSGKTPFGLYALINVEGSYWLDNLNLTGGVYNRNSNYTLGAEQLQRWTNFIEYGAGISICQHGFQYLYAERSPVMKSDIGRKQAFGRVSYRYTF